jgi:hypothetical protein
MVEFRLPHMHAACSGRAASTLWFLTPEITASVSLTFTKSANRLTLQITHFYMNTIFGGNSNTGTVRISRSLFLNGVTPTTDSNLVYSGLLNILVYNINLLFLRFLKK